MHYESSLILILKKSFDLFVVLLQLGQVFVEFFFNSEHLLEFETRLHVIGQYLVVLNHHLQPNP